jgi:hypothetical protein
MRGTLKQNCRKSSGIAMMRISIKNLRRVFDFTPAVIILITYLGNDLFDNQLSFPLKAENAKPFFELAQEVSNPGRSRFKKGCNG